MRFFAVVLAHKTRQGRRVRWQVQQGHDSLPINGKCPCSDLLRFARHQAWSSSASARAPPLVRQLLLTQPRLDLQSPTSSACLLTALYTLSRSIHSSHPIVTFSL